MSVNVFQNGQLTPVSASSNEFVGTTEEFNQAVSEGKIKEGMIVNITDDADIVNLVSKDDVISSIKDVVINTNPNKVASSNALKEVYLKGGSNVADMISEVWNETDEYMAGDYRINDNKVWKCLQDNVGVVPEEGVYWTQVNVADEVGRINSKLYELLKPIDSIFGTSVDISSYNKSDKKYICPCDGYVRCNGNNVAIQINSFTIKNGINSSLDGIYVRKGCSVYFTGTISLATFLPLKTD